LSEVRRHAAGEIALGIEDLIAARLAESDGEVVELTKLNSPSPINPDMLTDLGFILSGNDFCYQGIVLRLFGDHWRISLGDSWEYWANPTLGGLLCLAKALGISFAREAIDAALPQAKGTEPNANHV
jgi:hypothetical protein